MSLMDAKKHTHVIDDANTTMALIINKVFLENKKSHASA